MKASAALSILLFLATGGSAAAQAERGLTEQSLRALDDRERIAALNRDVPMLESLWSEHFTVNAPNNQVVVGRQQNLETFVRSGIINFASFDRAIEFVDIDGDFGVVMGLETVVPRSDAPSAGLVAGQAVRRRFTNIWRREGDTWRLYWRHANVIPGQ
jgi:ketosteroid isomerase-like protein